MPVTSLCHSVMIATVRYTYRGDVMAEATPTFVDPGTAPEYFADGLYSVDCIGPVCRLTYYANKISRFGHVYQEPVLTVVIPREAVPSVIGVTAQVSEQSEGRFVANRDGGLQ